MKCSWIVHGCGGQPNDYPKKIWTVYNSTCVVHWELVGSHWMMQGRSITNPIHGQFMESSKVIHGFCMYYLSVLHLASVNNSMGESCILLQRQSMHAPVIVRGWSIWRPWMIQLFSMTQPWIICSSMEHPWLKDLAHIILAYARILHGLAIDTKGPWIDTDDSNNGPRTI